MQYGAIETGGTKTVMAIFDETGKILRHTTIPTKNPDETLPEMIAFFGGEKIASLGICSFGPLDLNRGSKTYGNITSTPKPGWQDAPLLRRLRDELHVPMGIDTDVNGAALAEMAFGATNPMNVFLYVTVGTGIGGGVIVHGEALKGMSHISFGHMVLSPHGKDPVPRGFCPFHEGCLEGLASGPAITKRWQMSAERIPQNHLAWEIEAFYLAQMCANSVLMFSPEKICIGGGVMQRDFLFPMIRKETVRRLGGYVRSPSILNEIDSYIIPPTLGPESGIKGAFLLAKKAIV